MAANETVINKPVDPDRPLWGARAIGAEIDRTERQAFYMLESGHLPGTKVGKTWVSTPRKLRERITGETEAA